MSFLDKLKFWKRPPAATVDPIGPPEPTLIDVADILTALADREAENRAAAGATDSFHQRDKHNDRADEDAWIASKIREKM